MLDTPDDDVPEPSSQSPQETDVHEGKGPQQHKIAGPWSCPGQSISANNTDESEMTAEIIEDMRGHYVVPDGDQDPGVESGEYRTRLKRKAECISMSQYKVYSFPTKHNLSEPAVDEL